MPRIQFLPDRVMIFGQEGFHVNLTYPQWFFCIAMWEQFLADIKKVKV